MQTYQTVLGTLSGVIALASYVPYVVSILRGNTTPSRATFGIWSCIGSVQVASYIAAGARTTIWLPLVYAAGSILVFCLSIRRGAGGTQKLDLLCLAGALSGAVGWLLTKNPQVALYCSLFASSCGFLPTIKKAYFHPQTESALSWGMCSVAGISNLLALSSLALHIALYPTMIFLLDTTIALLAIFPAVRPTRMSTSVDTDTITS